MFIWGCAHKPSPIEDRKSYSQSIEKLNLSSSFAFSVDNHDYYFVAAETEGYLNDCRRFDGYKDDRLTYSFGYTGITELNEVYKSNVNIDVKIRKALEKIESLSPRLYECEPRPKQTLSTKIYNAADTSLNFLVYGSMAVLVLPLVIPASLNDYIIQSGLLKKQQQIRLGDSYDKVNSVMQSPSSVETVAEYLVQSYVYAKSFDGQVKMVFIYKNKKLIAYVWGLAR